MKIVAHIHGGVLQEVITDSKEKIEFVLIDDDDLEAEGLSREERDNLWLLETNGLERSIF